MTDLTEPGLDQGDGDALAQVAAAIRRAMVERGYVTGDGLTASPARLRAAMLAADPDQNVDQGALGYLVKGIRQRWGLRLLQRVVEFLGLDEVTAGEMAHAVRARSEPPAPSVSLADDAYARRPPLISTVAPGWALADVEDLLPTVVVASTEDFAGSRTEQTVLAALRTHARVDVVCSADPARIDVEENAFERLRWADLVVLVVTGEHVRATGNGPSVFDELLRRAAVDHVPVLALVTTDAWRTSDELRWHSTAFVRTVVERITDPTPAPPLLRVVNLPQDAEVQRAIHSLLNGMSRWGLVFGAKLGNQIWSDPRLKARELACREVWIYTSTFYFEIDDPMWRAIVAENVRTRTAQRWLFPPEQRDRAREVLWFCEREAPRGETAMVELYELDRPVWWPELCIYDPRSDRPEEIDAFLYSLEGLPQMGPGGAPLAIELNLRLGDDLTRILIDEFDSCCTDEARLESRTSSA